MHKNIVPLILFSAFLYASFAQGETDEERKESLVCNVGPIERDFGGSKWILYSCGDSESLVIISAKGNPAMPFYFMIKLKDGTRQLYGEGNGAKEATSAAYEELSILIESESDVQALINATKQLGVP